MFLIFGLLDVFAISKVVKIVVTSNLKLFTDGSGQPTERKCHQQIKSLKVGPSIHGLKLVTRKLDNLITLNLI